MFSTLETERLILRPYTVEDAEAAMAIYNNPTVMRFINPKPVYTPKTLEEQRADLERIIPIYRDATDGRGFWAAEEKATGIVVGTLMLKPLPGHDHIEIGWHFGQFAWGKGYAPEGGQAVLDYGFNTVGLEEIIAVVDPLNTASIRVTEKLGLIPNGQITAYEKLLNLYTVRRPQ